jgi:hypothetical protein
MHGGFSTFPGGEYIIGGTFGTKGTVDHRVFDFGGSVVV